MFFVYTTSRLDVGREWGSGLYFGAKKVEKHVDSCDGS